MQSVRESRVHHLFDGYPGLIAVFRALQSFLTPRHPPCALNSLTTRIECSRNALTTEMAASLRKQCHRVASLHPEPALASAPATQGTTIIFNSAATPFGAAEKSKNYLALFHENRSMNCFIKRSREPWENASESCLENSFHQHSFKMPITTTKLSKNKASRQCNKHRRLVTLSH